MKLNVELRVTSVRDTSVYKIMSMGKKMLLGSFLTQRKKLEEKWVYSHTTLNAPDLI